MVICGFFIGAFWWLWIDIILMAICGFSIDAYWWLYYYKLFFDILYAIIS
jgi:hypothetical protein